MKYFMEGMVDRYSRLIDGAWCIAFFCIGACLAAYIIGTLLVIYVWERIKCGILACAPRTWKR